MGATHNITAPDENVVLDGRYQQIEVILKVAERCNLACSYCYYFFGGDESYKDRPPLMSLDTIVSTARFLRDGMLDLNIPTVKVVFHGGEPLLLKPSVFDAMCEAIREEFGTVANPRFHVQTNALLINDRWLEVLSKHQVNVCVSIDGEKALHDAYRYDRKGRPTFDKTIEKIRLLKERASEHPCLKPSVLMVLRAGYDYRDIFKFLVDDLGVSSVGVLLPDSSHEDGIPDGRPAEEYGDALWDLFEEWSRRPAVRFREGEKALAPFSKMIPGPFTGRVRNPVIIVQSDGFLSIDDSYIPAKSWRQSMPTTSVSDTTLRDWLSQPIFRNIEGAFASLPDGCRGCTWANMCGGGDLENRYSSERGLNNPSIYCNGLQTYYERVVRYLARNQYPLDDIMSVLDAEYVGLR
ncbi:uncharacterized protein QO010_004017 [Caulobacter ginsengisoli]|uniref:Radical SAM core domain-containing protein n=1 Tax=Caulobacter ginsengisoli TaxID=400775 RepID=A0ABU0IW30_9CAUL|nr:radical SAM protein [Caulobacter ginsengisoli]MDQ0466224.1 uncharacterized protein [Caulobacter ginsengisoli]